MVLKTIYIISYSRLPFSGESVFLKNKKLRPSFFLHGRISLYSKKNTLVYF